MAKAALTRDEVTAILADVFRRAGFEGASMSDFSAATGLGKSSLYHHFPGGKEEMAQAVLERAAAGLARDVVAPLKGAAPPRARLLAMTRSLDTLYEGGRAPCLLAAFAVERTRGQFQPRLKAIVKNWMAALGDLLKEGGLSAADAKAKAEDAVIRIQGALVVSAALEKTAPFRRALKAIDGLLP
ncbi:MAG: TetR family transcriptional regulator [Alphaproteobacteria bacterium]|nr:TetR family transcriptional regulator [Alphaproteobacteria bacterium]